MIPYHSFPPKAKSQETFRIVPIDQYVRVHKKQSIHRHSFYELLFVWQGSGQQFVDFQAYPVQDNSLVFIQPDQVHQACFTNLDQSDVLVFNSEFYSAHSAFLQNFLFPRQTPLIALPDVAQLPFKNYLALLKEEYFSYRSPIILRNLLGVIFELFSRYYTSSTDKRLSKSDPRTTTFQQLLEHYYAQEHLPGFYADQISITVKHLNNVVKQDLGKSATQLIRDRVLLESKRLLSYSNMTQKEIAFQVGFSDPSYFSHFFKRYTGLSPSQFKAE